MNIKIENTSNIEPPMCELISKNITFGKVEGEYRGDNIMEEKDNIIINDSYYWLRDDERKKEKILNYIENENKYFDKLLFDSNSDNEIFNNLVSIMKSRLNENYISNKNMIGNVESKFIYKYFYKHIENKSFIVHYLQEHNTEDNTVIEYEILDENKLQTDPNKRLDVSSLKFSYDNNYLLYGIDKNGDELYDISIFDISDKNNKKLIDHKLPKILYSNFTIDKEFKYILFIGHDEANRPNTVNIYDVKKKETKIIWKISNISNDVDVYFSSDYSTLFLEISSYSSNSIYYLNINELNYDDLINNENCKLFKIIFDKIDNIKYDIDKIDNYFVFIKKTPDKELINFLPFYVSIDEIEKKDYKYIDIDRLKKKIGINNDNLFFTNIFTTENFLILGIRDNGNSKIIFTKFLKHEEYPFDKNWKILSSLHDCSVLGISNSVFKKDLITVNYTSFITPSVYSLVDLNNDNIDIVHKITIPNYNEENYTCKRLYVKSHDNKDIPISMIFKKSLNLEQENFLHLYAYGSYGINVDPHFDSKIITLLDLNYIYVIAHVRGSSFLGNHWYEDGKLEKKINTFKDLEYVIKYLIDNKYTNSKKTSFEGRSAGGLLAGYCLVKLNNYFNSIIANVPFVDILVTMSDPSIPLTSSEWEQWGNPNNKEDFLNMKEYSPIDNIKYNKNYPNYFILGGLNDPRVPYWEPLKFVAKLRRNHISDEQKIQILNIMINDGHFTSNDRYKYINEKAKEYLFLLKTIK